MGCFIIIFALIGPRVALAFTWIFTTLVDRAYDNFIIPVLGFVFLPWTTLVYALAYDGHDVSALGWFCVAIALFADVSSYTVSARRGYSY
jgi:hypothetical protein